MKMENEKKNPLFIFMWIGSIIYAAGYTFLLYKNSSGITYPFFVGGTCLFFFLYLKKSGITAKKDTAFYIISLLLLGISTCLTDSFSILLFNKLGIFLLLFCMMLHCLYQDSAWNLPKYLGSVCNLVITSLLLIFHPLTDLIAHIKWKEEKENKPRGKGIYIVYGILIALPLLFVIMLLLSSADAVFFNLFDYLLSDILEFLSKLNIWGVTFTFLFAFIAAYCILSGLSKRSIKEETVDKRTAEPVIAITFTGLLSFIYLIFCFIQIFYLFAGGGKLPEGYTYAQYARQGFFQLVFVCLINLSLVLICIGRFRENKILKGILTFISLCTYIMIASSVYRMLLYIQVYHLTFLRIFVLWALFVIFILLSAVVIMIYKEDFPFFKFSLISVTLLYLCFSFSRPDYWIAKYNLTQIYSGETTDNQTENPSENESTAYLDQLYLTNTLSLDAAPAILSMAEEKGYSKERWYKIYLDDLHYLKIDERVINSSGKLSLRKWNLSRFIAYKYFY